ncbi:hypothetical protein CEXT_699801 [Caerostris extrusa]|uniref:Uncharacterized protein n=1 Tax=Caerostris extrusa TaxID=172846 RepID=A0AAV4PNW4_CAEEX|nr:hypothetical protein CEXT_699801 [Caerostris extrusa]
MTLGDNIILFENVNSGTRFRWFLVGKSILINTRTKDINKMNFTGGSSSSALQSGLCPGFLLTPRPFRYLLTESAHLIREVAMNQWLFLQDKVISSMPNPQPGGPAYLSSSGNSPQTCPAWVIFTGC